jgi:hypothetical protein
LQKIEFILIFQLAFLLILPLLPGLCHVKTSYSCLTLF